MRQRKSRVSDEVSREEGISELTLNKWRAEGHILPDADTGTEGSSSRDKLAAALTFPACSRNARFCHCWKLACFLPPKTPFKTRAVPERF